jgi:uncharacterized protein with von Willebrand factor type A (vWA) domain
MDSTKAEFIFVIDRSGSMDGLRMNRAKDALKLFLKSLPINSYFNVISFGSASNKMFPNSVIFNSQNLQTAIKKVNSFKADMGGTELLDPIN